MSEPISVTLRFHPDDVENLRAVRRDKLAWCLWLAWKRGHIVSQDFENDCLAAAAALRRGRAVPFGSNFMGDNREKFFATLMSVLRGLETIRTIYPGRFGWQVVEDVRGDLEEGH